MRALYGIQGTGNGHLARARALAPALREAGVELDFVVTGRKRQDCFDMDAFPDFDCFRGLSLALRKGRLRPFGTVFGNNVFAFARDLGKLDLRRYDLVISDFEPLTAWAARLRNVPVVGVSHQCAFDHAVPKVRGYRASVMVMRHFAPASVAIGLHWHHFGQPVLPPLIGRLEAKRPLPGKVLVYMVWEPLDKLIEFLRPLATQCEFIIYTATEAEHAAGSITIKPLSYRNFHRDLQDCAGIISNAGFELSSEGLAMGKKLLLKPISGQYEQLCNALALQALGRATVVDSLDRDTLGQWLELPMPQRVAYPDVAAAVAGWIAAGRPVALDELASDLWRSTDLPLVWDADFGERLRFGLLA